MNTNVHTKHPLFAHLSDTECAEALAFFDARRATFCRGEFLKHAGDALPAFGIVLSGTVQVFLDDMEGNEILMASVGQGESFGESLAYLSIMQSPVYILAAEDSEVLWLSPKSLHQTALCRTPLSAMLCERFTALLATRALAMNDRIQILSRPSLREKITVFLSRCAHRYGSDTFRIPFDRAALAAYLGVNRSALSRELSAMKKEGLIDFFRSSFRLLGTTKPTQHP